MEIVLYHLHNFLLPASGFQAIIKTKSSYPELRLINTSKLSFGAVFYLKQIPYFW